MKVSEMPSDPSEREMAEPVTDEARSSVATVVQGFTAAELALRDVALAIERFGSAAEQLSEAREDQAAARVALLETVQVTDRVAVQISAVVEGLRDTTAVLRGIDPDRLWSHLDKLEGQQAEAATALDAWMTKADSRLVKLYDKQAATVTFVGTRIAGVDQGLAKIEGQLAAAANALEARMVAVEGASRRIAWLCAGALIAGLAAVALLAAIVAGVAPGR